MKNWRKPKTKCKFSMEFPIGGGCTMQATKAADSIITFEEALECLKEVREWLDEVEKKWKNRR